MSSHMETGSCKETMDYYGILGFYPTKAGYNHKAAMSALNVDRRSSQPDILDSKDAQSFYTSNYTSVYSSGNTTTENNDTEPGNGWLGAKNYAMVPRMGRRASKDINTTKYYQKREGNSRSDNKKDYQDVYKDRKDKVDRPRKQSVDTLAAPAVPNRKYSRDDDFVAYEDLFEETPPKLAPVSGYLHQNAGKAVVRPIAFKPVVPTPKQNTIQSTYNNNNLSPDVYVYEKQPHFDDGYSSQESRACSHNGTMRDSYIYDARPGSFESNHYREQKPVDCYQVTPSPTDNGAAHYEQLVQDKEREMVILRETMEANERVIFEVNEERRLNWESQMQELTSEYHRRLRLQQDRALKTEQDLQNQINKLQKDNQKLIAEREQLLTQSEHNSFTQEQLKSLRSKNDDLMSKLSQVSCDCDSLRKQVKEKESNIQTLEELVTVIKAENMNLTNELDDKRRVIKKLSVQEQANPAADRESKRLEKLLHDRELALQAEREQYDNDRELWEQEKKKVLQYQKQLQSNYIQMCRRNTELESCLSSAPRSRSSNNSSGGVSRQPMYPPAKSHDKAHFKAHLDATPESLC